MFISHPSNKRNTINILLPYNNIKIYVFLNNTLFNLIYKKINNISYLYIIQVRLIIQSILKNCKVVVSHKQIQFTYERSIRYYGYQWREI